MGAGRRTETYLGPHFPSASSPASSSSSTQFLNLPLGELASVIFGCTHATFDECVNQLIFGLPQHHYSYIKNIQPGMPLFLFNYSDRKLHGIFEADSRGDLNINPRAWTGAKAGKTQFPAQVRVAVRCLCSPLTEKVFKEAIAANYLKDPQNHFHFELNHVQTDVLLSLFMRNTTYLSSQAGPLVQTQAGDEDGWITPKKTAKSVMDAWHNAAPFVRAPSPTSPAQRRADTPEHWEDGSDKVGDEITASNGGPDSQNAMKSSLEAVAEMAKLLNGKSSEVQEDRRKAEAELECFEKLRRPKQKGKMQSNVEKIRVEAPRVRGELEGEASGSSSVESTKVQDSAHVEWEQLAIERCLQEQTMLKEEREQLREKFKALDALVAKAINKNLEICASAIAQMRQDQINLRHGMDEALNQAELLTELDLLREKNASLEETQIQMASELEGLKADVARISHQLDATSIRRA